jgi:hypothetical protein
MILTGPIVRADTKRHLVNTLLSTDGSEELEDAVYRYLERTTWDSGRIIESFVFTGEKEDKLSLANGTGWWLGLALQPAEWSRVLAGELDGVRVEIVEKP